MLYFALRYRPVQLDAVRSCSVRCNPHDPSGGRSFPLLPYPLLPSASRRITLRCYDHGPSGPKLSIRYVVMPCITLPSVTARRRAIRCDATTTTPSPGSKLSINPLCSGATHCGALRNLATRYAPTTTTPSGVEAFNPTPCGATPCDALPFFEMRSYLHGPSGGRSFQSSAVPRAALHCIAVRHTAVPSSPMPPPRPRKGPKLSLLCAPKPHSAIHPSALLRAPTPFTAVQCHYHGSFGSRSFQQRAPSLCSTLQSSPSLRSALRFVALSRPFTGPKLSSNKWPYVPIPYVTVPCHTLLFHPTPCLAALQSRPPNGGRSFLCGPTQCSPLPRSSTPCVFDSLQHNLHDPSGGRSFLDAPLPVTVPSNAVRNHA